MSEMRFRHVIEARLQARLDQFHAKWEPRVQHGHANWEQYEQELTLLLLLYLPRVYDQMAGQAVAEFGGRQAVSGAAWSDVYASDLAQQIAGNTRQWSEAGEMERAFGAGRSETISATETTRAATEGEESVLADLRKQGAAITSLWRTSEDERVCPICRPLDGEDQHLWSQKFSMGPPAHPRCRCWLEHHITVGATP